MLSSFSILAVVLSLSLSACDTATTTTTTTPADDTARVSGNVVRPGLGEDPGDPEVTPFNLPEGVRVAGVIRGADEVSGLCEDTAAQSHGSGAYVRVCIPLENLTGSPVQVEFPPGLVVVSTGEGRGQHGLLIERTVLTLPPTIKGGAGCRQREKNDPGAAGGEEDICPYVVPLYLYCLNEERDPSNQYMTYAIAGTTTDGGLRELLQHVSGRKVDHIEHVSTVQNAIYSITDGHGLTSEDISLMRRIPSA